MATQVVDDKVRVSRGGGKPTVASPRQALALIADKWAVLVITTLATATWRYNALRRELAGVSQKMLTQTLRDLECNGLVERTVYPDTPPRVEYGLTPLGATLVEALTVLRDWADEHYHEVEAARRRYCGVPAEQGVEVTAGDSTGADVEIDADAAPDPNSPPA